MTQLPAAARAVGAAVTATVEAAVAADGPRFEQESAALAALDEERVRLVMGGLLSGLLEARLPDGLSGDDLRSLIERAVRGAAGWFPGVDAAAFVVVLTDALGVQRDDDEPDRLGHASAVRHGALLIAELLAAPAELNQYLRLAFAEIERDQTVELP